MLKKLTGWIKKKILGWVLDDVVAELPGLKQKAKELLKAKKNELIEKAKAAIKEAIIKAL